MEQRPRFVSVLSPQSSVLFLAFWLAIRLLYNSIRPLVPDEAYYWVWSRHLAGGYLDHPPMVAWIIRAATELLGTSEFSVRFGAAVLSAGMILVTIDLTRRTSPNPRAVSTAAWILLLSPFVAALGSIITPDTPACFFGIAALAAAVVATQKPKAWLAFGVCFGLAMLSKYTAVLVGGAVGLAILSSASGRKMLLSPWLWIGLFIAAAIFLPVINWNANHDWASFKFQWKHGTGEEETSAISNLLTYVAGQFAVYTPVLLVLGIGAVIAQCRTFATLDTAHRMVLIAAILPLAFFGVSSLRHRPEANWPILAYLPMTVVLSGWLAEKWELRRGLARLGIGIAAGMMIVAHLPEIMYLVPTSSVAGIPNPWEEMFGWRDYGHELDFLSAGGMPVFCTSYENAAEASFYMTGRPQVWTIDTNRPTEFDFLPGRPDPASIQSLVCVTRAGDSAGQAPADLARFANRIFVQWQTAALGRIVRRRTFIIAKSPD
jgi:4-amino-4-deoxy-L-arabinose transferase-like glycosyltransferase